MSKLWGSNEQCGDSHYQYYNYILKSCYPIPKVLVGYNSGISFPVTKVTAFLLCRQGVVYI